MILSGLGAGEGPVLLSNVNCNENNTNLSQCVHPEDIGLHSCDLNSIAGVMCSEIISSETTTASPLPAPSPNMMSLPAVIGGVVGALVVLIIAIIIVVILIVLVARRRKEDKDIAGKKPGKKASAKCFTVLMY